MLHAAINVVAQNLVGSNAYLGEKRFLTNYVNAIKPETSLSR